MRSSYRRNCRKTKISFWNYRFSFVIVLCSLSYSFSLIEKTLVPIQLMHSHQFPLTRSVHWHGVLASEGWRDAWQLSPQGNQEPLVVRDKVWRPHSWAWNEQVRGTWYFHPLVLWHCWLGDSKGVRPVKFWCTVTWKYPTFSVLRCVCFLLGFVWLCSCISMFIRACFLLIILC